MKKNKNSETQKRRSSFNPKRNSYMTKDGRYAYVTWDDEKKHKVTHYLEIGKEGVTEELLVILDEDDHQIDLQERYAAENTDFDFLNQQRLHNQSSDDYKIDPIDAIRDKKSDFFDLIFPQDDKTSELMLRLLEIMKKLTVEQRDLIYKHLGSMKQLEEIRRDEIDATGKAITQQAMSNRWKKIIFRLCKAFDVPVPKKRKTQKDK